MSKTIVLNARLSVYAQTQRSYEVMVAENSSQPIGAWWFNLMTEGESRSAPIWNPLKIV
jgi:hypothetical protein